MENNELDEMVVVDGQKAVATVAQEGEMVESNGVLDANCIIQTESGLQKAIKTYPVGGSGGASWEWVNALPEVGKKNTLYLVYSGITRDGYSIYQQFAWNQTTSTWVALGAFDTSVDVNNLILKTDKDVANGVAGLDANSQLNPSVIPYATSSTIGGIKQSFDAATGTWTIITEEV